MRVRLALESLAVREALRLPGGRDRFARLDAAAIAYAEACRLGDPAPIVLADETFHAELCRASGNPLSTLFQDYDWADEVLHAKIGRDWYLKDFQNAQEAVQYGDRCWSRVLVGWASWREQGLTQHRNWWPGLYRAACKHWKLEPDPKVLAYSTSYETVRADLKNVSSSG